MPTILPKTCIMVYDLAISKGSLKSCLVTTAFFLGTSLFGIIAKALKEGGYRGHYNTFP